MIFKIDLIVILCYTNIENLELFEILLSYIYDIERNVWK